MGWAYTSKEDTTMTLMLGMYNDNSVTVVCDSLSRMYDPDTNVEQEPITDTQKVFKLNDYIVVGYSNTGVSYDFMRGLLVSIKHFFAGETNLKVLAQKISGLVQVWNADTGENTKAQYRILIAGINEAGIGNPDLWVVCKTGQYGQSKFNWTAIGEDRIADPIYKKLSGDKRTLSHKEAVEIGAETLLDSAKLSEGIVAL